MTVKVHVDVKMGVVQTYVCCLLFILSWWSPSFGEDTGERNGAFPSASMEILVVPLVVFLHTLQRSELICLCAVAV